MADVFVSYASEDRERVRPLVAALEAQGWTVWWDQDISAGSAFRRVIGDEMKSCRCMVVAWSRGSIESDFVIDEAAEGKARNILVPVLLDDVQVPLGFRTAQTANLVDGLGNLDRMLSGVRRTLEGAIGPDSNRAERRARAPRGSHGELPDATVTLWFADLQASTRLAEELGERYAGVLTDYRGILTGLVVKNGGQIADTVGDGVFAVFASAIDAVECAVATQMALSSRRWPQEVHVAARIGMHTGQPKLSSVGYVGRDVHLAARISDAGHGGQVLLSESAADLVGASLRGGVRVKHLGSHRLRDLAQPERISQLVIPGLENEFPALRTADSYPSSIPQLATPTIGRADEIARLIELLAREDVRLVTITGPGGVGKTRIALDLAHRVRGDFKGGVFFVDFESASEATSIIHRIAESLRLDSVDSESVAQFLQHRRSLLVLDNLERLEDRVEELATLLQRCADVMIVATSRRPLRLRAEHEFPLQPLAVPDDTASRESAVSSPAFSLFVDRARAMTPSLDVTGDNVRAIADIVRCLDGLPLGIELAAARVKLFNPRQLLERLERPLDVLTRGARDRPARQRTLRDAIRWSYVMLSDTEQMLLRTLSVFPGGATIAMLESMVSRLGFGDASFVEDSLTVLLDESLATRSDDDEEPRYSMLRTIREFCFEELERLEQLSRVKHAHLSLLREFAVEVAATGQRRRELKAELENIRSALEFAFRQTETVAAGLELAAALTELWWSTDPAEGLMWLERGLEMASEAGAKTRARALGSAATLAHYARDTAYTLSLARQALEIGPAGDSQSRASALGPLALALADTGEHAQAQRAIEECVQLWRDLNPRLPLAIALGNAGFVAWQRGDPEAAEAAWMEAVELFGILGDASLVASPIIALGELAMRREEYALARSRFEESLALSRAAGQTSTTAWALANLGRAAQAEGDAEEAALFHRESLSLARELTSAGVATFGLAGASRWCLMQGKAHDAARLLGAVHAAPSSANLVTFWWGSELEQLAEGVRRRLGDSEYERAHELGKRFLREQAIGAALEVLPQ